MRNCAAESLPARCPGPSSHIMSLSLDTRPVPPLPDFSDGDCQTDGNMCDQKVGIIG